MAPFAGIASGVAGPQVGMRSPIGFSVFFVHDCTLTVPLAENVNHQASTAALSSTMPPAPAALRMSTREARKLLKLIGLRMIVRIEGLVAASYLRAPFTSVVLPVTLPSAYTSPYAMPSCLTLCATLLPSIPA